ncbi:ribonuclease R [Natronospira proteinivora]|uniref:Ribonuclease R n=1 Tax=Natronospira proteinivora TaxID=1807133 RepID=A0ABT1G5F4_9GAMM|nr:ribonuclease R [Natronospira proteinivora]MCP1726312.1 ribonuclease R [Natronospira proteinivora]
MTDTNNKTRWKDDPKAGREARRYEKPIPSREYILKHMEELGEPQEFDELVESLGLMDPEEVEALGFRIKAMIRDGQLITNRREALCLVDRVGLVTGTVVAHRDGFGFCTPDDGGGDIFMPPREMREIMHGDRVAVRVIDVDRRGRSVGSLARILERNTEDLIGRYFEESGISFVVPDNSRYNQDIFVPPEKRGGAKHGQIVQVLLEMYPSRRNQPIGRVDKVLGAHRDAGMEIDIAVHSHGLPRDWPEGVEAEAKAFGDSVAESSKAGRKDLRDLPLVTIDDETAKDFDDAVLCERLDNGGFRLMVAIADVAEYVQPDSALDAEAYRRGTSVYFPGHVIPMLPEVLSNGLCSLNPDVDRLTMVCELIMDKEGTVKESHFHEGVIRSHARLTYNKVSAMLQGDKALREQYQHVLGNVENLHELFKVLIKRRQQRGAIDFDTIETKFVFDDFGKIEKIVPVERNDAHRIIEECMIAANVATGRFLAKHEMPTLYRVHEGPAEEKVSDLRDFLGKLGLTLKGDEEPDPGHYAEVLKQAQGREDSTLIQTVLLRSLKQAVYSPKNVGHFGLAHDTYLHFTSPIRRYPDLLVHRAIKHVLRKLPEDEYPYSVKDMERIGGHCSSTERRADEATRDAADTLKCEFMQSRVGEEYDAMIVGVTSFGLFVKLKEVHVEGLVHVTGLPNDYYKFDPAGHRMVGERSGRIFRLTDTIRVRVVRVDPDERKIDLEPAEASEEKPSDRGGRKPKRKRGGKKGSRKKAAKKPDSEGKGD